MSTHLPTRPTWDCGACRQDWPCAAARHELRAEMHPGALAVYVGGHLADASADMPQLSPQALHHRFLGWTRAGLSQRGEAMVTVLPAAEVTGLAVPQQIRGLLAATLPLDRFVRWIATDPRDSYDLGAAFAEVHAHYLPAVAQIYVTALGDTLTGFIAGTHPMQPPEPGVMHDYEQDMVRAAGVYANRYVSQSRRHDARRPAATHFHLTHLAVHQEWQGQGLASSLLRHLTHRLDVVGVPCFTSGVRDAFMSVLTRHGFNLSAHIKGVEGGEPYILAMWRDVQALAPSARG